MCWSRSMARRHRGPRSDLCGSIVQYWGLWLAPGVRWLYYYMISKRMALAWHELYDTEVIQMSLRSVSVSDQRFQAGMTFFFALIGQRRHATFAVIARWPALLSQRTRAVEVPCPPYLNASPIVLFSMATVMS